MQPLTGLAREAAENRGSTLIYRFYELNAPGRTFARAQYPGLQPMAGAL